MLWEEVALSGKRSEGLTTSLLEIYHDSDQREFYGWQRRVSFRVF
jgi:hypothetical protein